VAKIIVTTDTDSEAVWFSELCKKLGSKVEVGFGNNASAHLSWSHSLEMQIDPKIAESFANSPFQNTDLARLCKKIKGKNSKK
jgi:hypothetical protein